MSTTIFRNQRIDLLRGIGVLLVMIHHFHIAYHLDQSAFSHILSSNYISQFINNGYYGVTMLFVASGFLITSKSIERYGTLGKVDAVGFYLLRFSRIMPSLLLVLSLIIIFNILQIPIFENKQNKVSLTIAIFSVLTFWHNILMVKAGWFNYCLNVLWSLSVTEIFYIAFPLICLFIKKDRWIILFLMMLIVIAPIYRSIYSNNEIIALCGNISCLDAIGVGCFSAIIANQFQCNRWLSFFAQLAGALIITAFYFNSKVIDSMVFGVLLVAIGTALLLIFPSKEFVLNNNIVGKFTTGIRWFGKNCYEVYLFQIIVLALMKEILSPNSLNDYTKLGWATVFFLSTAVVAHTVSKYYSQPINKKLREVFFSANRKSILLVSKRNVAALSQTQP